jgi:hypothetical protein
LRFNTFEVEEIQGDLIELFDRRVAESGQAAARRRYWGDVFRFMLRFSRKRKIEYPFGQTALISRPMSL